MAEITFHCTERLTVDANKNGYLDDYDFDSWGRTVVVRTDNLPDHKIESLKDLLEKYGVGYDEDE
jgi:hypothetical protein